MTAKSERAINKVLFDIAMLCPLCPLCPFMPFMYSNTKVSKDTTSDATISNELLIQELKDVF